ncbi:hypothetical protein ACJIZ3_016771 [Penstemon smallii]|uniref:Uncharacterized protein n=1 Tax=Penstemon smallii TaxID=265156 RepID=A0ABD3STN7_9LAMI
MVTLMVPNFRNMQIWYHNLKRLRSLGTKFAAFLKRTTCRTAIVYVIFLTAKVVRMEEINNALQVVCLTQG